MFARIVRVTPKPNMSSEFSRVIENDVVPVLQRQHGFRDEFTLVNPNGKEVLGVSFWDNKENAEAYSRSAYQEVLKTLGRVIEGTPQVQSYEVSTSTVHKIGTRAA